jgi:uncharacterized protein YcbK (DUF882 family)
LARPDFAILEGYENRIGRHGGDNSPLTLSDNEYSALATRGRVGMPQVTDENSSRDGRGHVPDQTARKARYPKFVAGRRCGLAAFLLFFGSQPLESVIANGDTRTISMHHLHTGEDLTVTFKRDGKYDDAALEKLNWLLRDWRVAQPIKMDPHLVDLIWEVNREVGGKEPIQIVCGYRSPSTNAMLRASSRGVAQFSQHMLGKAIDFYIPGVELTELREIGLKLQRGGVGFYPTSGWPFVHLDTGNVRHWPTVTREYLAHLFPDGKTVHIPSDGRPMPGYQLAQAEIQARGQEVVPLPAFASRNDAGGGEEDSAADGSRLKRLVTSIFGKKNGGEDEGGKIATKPVAVASLAASSGPQLQWTKGPDAAAPAAAAPLPRTKPSETSPKTVVASLPIGERKPASASEVTASLPLAITGGEKPGAALAYAGEAVPQRVSAPVAPPVAAPRPQPQETARAQEQPVRSPGLFGDAAHSPSNLLSKTPVQFTAGLRHPDQSGLAILLDPAATTAGYFAQQSGGKIAAGSLVSTY